MKEITLADYHRLYVTPARSGTWARQEVDEQIALFHWIDLVKSREPRLAWAFHCPNGELREKAVAAKLQRMGVQRGVPDVLLPIPARGFVGLAIELKVGNNTCTPEQLQWLLQLQDSGWDAHMIMGWESTARHLCWYLDRDPEELGL